jgi:hypothetical protein
MKQLNEVARMQQLAGIKEIKVNNPIDPVKLEIDNALLFIDKNVDFYENDTDEHSITNSVSYYLQAHNTTISDKFWVNLDLYEKYIEYKLEKYPNIYREFGNNQLNEIKVNNPTNIGFEIFEDDDNGEVKFIKLAKDNNVWYGHIPYTENPNLINVEFMLNDIDGDEYELKQMNELIKLLNKYNKPYKEIDIEGDRSLIYIQFKN